MKGKRKNSGEGERLIKIKYLFAPCFQRNLYFYFNLSKVYFIHRIPMIWADFLRHFQLLSILSMLCPLNMFLKHRVKLIVDLIYSVWKYLVEQYRFEIQEGFYYLLTPIFQLVFVRLLIQTVNLDFW